MGTAFGWERHLDGNGHDRSLHKYHHLLNVSESHFSGFVSI